MHEDPASPPLYGHLAELPSFDQAGHQLIDRVSRYLHDLPDGAVWKPLPDELRDELLAMPIPEDGASLDEIV